jgi:hypothetical protein
MRNSKQVTNGRPKREAKKNRGYRRKRAKEDMCRRNTAKEVERKQSMRKF